MSSSGSSRLAWLCRVLSRTNVILKCSNDSRTW
ncbi:Uncharacterised protein [Mycobacterium tuberculosis]|nr:Uncharacterised protein [Mycobacterium tuberculosis]